MDRFDLFKKYRGKLPFAYNATKGFRNSIRQILEEFKDDIVNIDIHERRKIPLIPQHYYKIFFLST
jgi:hypothetical protein